jgi:hypothetical protein
MSPGQGTGLPDAKMGVIVIFIAERTHRLRPLKSRFLNGLGHAEGRKNLQTGFGIKTRTWKGALLRCRTKHGQRLRKFILFVLGF